MTGRRNKQVCFRNVNKGEGGCTTERYNCPSHVYNCRLTEWLDLLERTESLSAAELEHKKQSRQSCSKYFPVLSD